MILKKIVTFPIRRVLAALSPDMKFRLGIPDPIVNADRDFLEKDIFSYVNSIAKKGDKLLFMGVGPYTWHYYSKLKYEVSTIDFDKERAKFGNKGKHVVGSATQLNEFYKKDFFKVILSNGLIGYGMGTQNEFEDMIKTSHECLTADGILIVGYNNNPSHLAFSLMKSPAYALFDEYTPPIDGMNSSSIEINLHNNHTFLFLRKKAN